MDVKVNQEDVRSGRYGQTVLQCRFGPLFAFMIMAFGLILTCLMTDALSFNIVLSSQKELLFKCMFAGMLLFGVLILYAGVRQLLNPSVLFEVTEMGMVNYYQGAAVSKEGDFIPWDEIIDISYEKIQMSRNRLRENTEIDVSSISTFNADRHAVLFDAFSGTPSGEAAVHSLQRRQSQIWHMTSVPKLTRSHKQPACGLQIYEPTSWQVFMLAWYTLMS